MSEKKIKVIDRRMFTSDGELREKYQGRGDPDASAPTHRRPAAEPAAPAAVEPTGPAGPSADLAMRPAADKPTVPSTSPSAVPSPAPDPADEVDGPRFTDLVAFMAQTAAAYMQQARASALGGGAGPSSSSEMLQMARLHVDLLSVLERKTTGNLTAEEHDMLVDVQRQLRMSLQ